MLDGKGFEGGGTRTYSRTNCSHVDQVHLVVEVRQSSVDIIEFKPAVHWYVVLIHDCRSQVRADDFNMRVSAGRGHSPEEKIDNGENQIKNPGQRRIPNTTSTP